MVPVPAGEFWYGCNESVDKECDDDEKPGRQITLPAFQIDRTEVTVSAYRRCVESGGCSTDGLKTPYWLGEEKPTWAEACNWGKPGREGHPINCVDWYQTKAYCAWAGKRLPSDQEWEKAARGPDGRKYPWGSAEISCSYAVINDERNGCGRDSTWPVGSKPSGASPYGALDMGGNVWEWTSSWYSSKRESRSVRGGSLESTPEWGHARASNHGGRGPASRLDDVGFRCAR